MVVGGIIPFGGGTIPEGFLACDGTAVSRNDYAELFEVIGDTYGVGDESTTFNLPNLNGRVALGVSSGHALATTGGATTVTLSSVPSHLHVVPEHGHGNSIAAKTPSLSHSITQPVFKYTQLNGTGTMGPMGSDYKNLYTSRTSASMSRATNLAISDHAATACTMSGAITDCAALTSGSTGGGAAHNNMMPYLAVNYIIRAVPETPPAPPEPRILVTSTCIPMTPGGYYLGGTA